MFFLNCKSILFFAKTRRWKSFLFLFILFFVLFSLKRSIQSKSCLIEEYRSRLFCFVMTNETNLLKGGSILYETWGHRCGMFKFIIKLNQSQINEEKYLQLKLKYPLEYLSSSSSSSAQFFEDRYENLSKKLRETLFHLYENYPNYLWYFKGDDDTYLIVENLLRYLISRLKKSDEFLLYGYRFRESNYVSGGAGYVLTSKAMKLFYEYFRLNFYSNFFWNRCETTMEDLTIGSCLEQILQFYREDSKEKSLFLIDETIDENGAERFHPLPFRLHFNGPSNQSKRQWIHFRPFHHNLFGLSSISPTTISFHYTDFEDMLQIDSFLYRIRQYDQLVCQH